MMAEYSTPIPASAGGGDSREVFMERVRQALEHDATAAPSEPAPAVDESLARLATAADDLPAMFEQRGAAVGMKVYRCESENLTLKLGSILDLIDADSAVLGLGSMSEVFDVEGMLRQRGVGVVDWREVPQDAAGRLEPQYEVSVGITDVAAALAETGTMVMHSDARHSRGLSLVPPNHIAIVRGSDILPDMIDYWHRLAGIPHTELPSSQTFITGPSKTADIEGHLITGVHGPGSVHILLVMDL